MHFDPNQTEFTCDHQRNVWQYGIHIMPPEISLAGIEDKNIHEGCMQIYNCAMEIMTECYINPEEYLEGPGWYLGHDGLMKLTLLGGKLVKRDTDKYLSSLQKIGKFGFTYNEETKTLSNNRYPLFCEYFTQFLHLYKKREQNMGDHVKKLDFRLFAKRRKYTLDDLLRPMSDEKRAQLLKLREYAIENGITEKNNSTRYLYKDARVFDISNIPLSFSVQFRPFEHFLEIVEKQPDADKLVEFIIKHFDKCDGCAANTATRAKEKEPKKCGYYWVNIRGENILSCSSSRIGKCVNNEEDIKMAKRLIEIRMEQIDIL